MGPKGDGMGGRCGGAQRAQIPYIFFDASSRNSFMPTLFPPIEAGSIAKLAGEFELDPAALEKTVGDFNAAVRPGTFDHTILDHSPTKRPPPPNTHSAPKIQTPPFYAY